MPESLGSQEKPHFESIYSDGVTIYSSEDSPILLDDYWNDDVCCLSWPTELSKEGVVELMRDVANTYGVEHCQSVHTGGRLVDEKSLEEILVEGSLPPGAGLLRLESGMFTLLWEDSSMVHVEGSNDQLSVLISDKTLLGGEVLRSIVGKALEVQQPTEDTELALQALHARLNTIG